MHPNFIALLFLLAFANVVNAKDSKETKTFPEVVRHASQSVKKHVVNTFHKAANGLRHATHVVAEDLDNAAHDVDKHLEKAKNRLANIKNEANADIHKFLTKLTEKDGEKAVEMAKQENENELKKFKMDVKGLEYAGKLVVTDADKKKFQELLINEDRVESLIKVFEYLVGLDSVPICVAKQFLESIDPKNLIIGQLGKRVQKSATPHASADGRKAFIFSQTGVRQLDIDEEGIECKESLKEARNVSRLLLEIVVGLEEEEKARKGNNASQQLAVKGEPVIAEIQNDTLKKLACSNKIKVVFKQLKNFKPEEHAHAPLKAVVEIVKKKISHWETIGTKLGTLGEHFKDYAVFLLKPANFQYFLTAVISIAKLSGTMTLAVTTVRAFGLDELLTKEIESFTSNHVCDAGVICEVDLWLFGVNGVIPLYLRGYSVEEKKVGHAGKDAKERHYYDHTGKEYSQKEVEQWKHSEGDDEKFIKTIVNELIEHKGLAFEHIMHGTMEKLKSLGSGKKWHERADKFKQGWEKTKNKLATLEKEVKEIDPHKVLTSVGNMAKDFTLFLITPRHIAFAFKLILTIFNLYTPVYISLEVLELLGITDIIIEMMKVSAESIEKANGFREGRKAEGAMDFMFNENGVVPMLLTMGKEEDTKKRRLRVANELEMFSLIKDAIVQHNGNSLKELYNFFVDKIKQNTVGLTIAQTFQKQEVSNAKLQWNHLRWALAPKLHATLNLEYIIAQGEKNICHAEQNNKRLQKFDDEISGVFMKEMNDVSKLKMERGDCNVFHVSVAVGRANDRKQNGTLPKANHPKDVMKHQDYGNIDI